MPTAWLIRDKLAGGSGPTWDAMLTDDTDDYDSLIDHKWEWTSTWEIFAKSTSDTGVLWGAVSQYWPDYTFTLAESPWSIIGQSKIQAATET